MNSSSTSGIIKNSITFLSPCNIQSDLSSRDVSDYKLNERNHSVVKDSPSNSNFLKDNSMNETVIVCDTKTVNPEDDCLDHSVYEISDYETNSEQLIQTHLPEYVSKASGSSGSRRGVEPEESTISTEENALTPRTSYRTSLNSTDNLNVTDYIHELLNKRNSGMLKFPK